MRPALGFLVAPAVGVLLPVLLMAVASRDYSVNKPGEAVMLLIPLAVAYASALLFGVPLFLLFKRLGWLRLWQVAAASVLCGIPFAVFQFLQSKMVYAPIELSVRWFGSILMFSTLAGLTFWVVALWKRHEP